MPTESEVLALLLARISYAKLKTWQNLGATCIFETSKNNVSYWFHLKFLQQSNFVLVTCRYLKWCFISPRQQFYFNLTELKPIWEQEPTGEPQLCWAREEEF